MYMASWKIRKENCNQRTICVRAPTVAVGGLYNVPSTPCALEFHFLFLIPSPRLSLVSFQVEKYFRGKAKEIHHSVRDTRTPS